MHGDSYASAAVPVAGPLGHDLQIQSYAHGAVGGECATVTFNSRGQLVAVCATFKNFALLLIDPADLRPLARLDLSPRASSKSLNLRTIMTDTSGGSYFFLDRQERVVLVNAHQQLLRIALDENETTPRWVIEQQIELQPTLDRFRSKGDVVTAVLPDWNGKYWFVSRYGVIGVADRSTGAVKAINLGDESIQNSFAVDEDGVYVVSDHALYGLRADAGGGPTILWREPYTRADARKPGSIDLGSGTTPTLLGERYVAIADNADPQIHVLVYRRDAAYDGERLVCKVPVFPSGRSATEVSFVGIDNGLVVENNHGYDLFPTMMFGRRATGGLARVDVSDDESGCRVIWESAENSQTTTPKLSLESGLLYTYTKDAAPWAIDASYFTAIDFRSGQTVFKKLVGTGLGYENNWGPLTLGPDGCAYVGVLRGLVQICDGA